MSSVEVQQAPGVISTPTNGQMQSMQSITTLSPTPAQTMKPKDIYTINDLICDRAVDSKQVPLVAYPRDEQSLTEYEHFTASELERIAGLASRTFIKNGLKPTAIPSVVALLGPSNLDYLASMFGLSRLGHTVLFLSPRLTASAYVNLLEKTKCHTIVATPHFDSVIKEVQGIIGVNRLPLLTRPEYSSTDPSDIPYVSPPGIPEDSSKLAFIVHSSGSTGLPKPILQSHGSCLSNFANGFPLRAFITLPLYHNHGLSCFFRSVYSRNEIFFYNASLPLTGPNLATVIEQVKPRIIFSVPYALKLLGENQRGIDGLKSCEIVLFGGSGCPDELGNRLVGKGVNLIAHYGATEVGQLMTSLRPVGDNTWDYCRIMPSCAPWVLMDEISPGSYEVVVLDGLKSKTATNSNNPPNSFRTRDIFTRHPLLNAWKYMGRLDDRVTLMNGEKVLPLPIEGRIREEPAVLEAVVFGIGKTLPGLLAIRSDAGRELSNDEFIERIWPTVEAANMKAESFSRIDRHMIVPLAADTTYPRTDKGTFIRAQMYMLFESQIEAAYDQYENGKEGTLVLDKHELEKWLMNMFVKHVDCHLESTQTDFFSAGIDSLQAIKMWSFFKRELSLGGNGAKMTQNAVFEQQNVAQLAAYLYSLRTGEQIVQEDEIGLMENLVQKYSNFTQHVGTGIPPPSSDVLIITGTTGSLGAHILFQSICQPTVSKVYCLVRASTIDGARSRVLSSLTSRQFNTTPAERAKIVALPSDFSQSNLGLTSTDLDTMLDTVTCIIHSAWAVNFNLGVQSFEAQHIKGTFNLLNFSLSVRTPSPARFYFCSSISAGAGKIPATISEGPIEDFSQAQNMGYAQSKLVTEHLVANATATGANARVFRIGQIVGDGAVGMWNETEAIPLLIRSALNTGCLPALDENPSWLPVDILASSILELSQITTTAPSQIPNPSLTYHLLNPLTFSWTNDLLPALRAAGLTFDTVPQREWISRLRASDPDPVRNPSIKLVDFFAEKYDNDAPGRKGLVFQTERIEKDCEALRGGVDVIGSGYVRLFVECWLKGWM